MVALNNKWQMQNKQCSLSTQQFTYKATQFVVSICLLSPKETGYEKYTVIKPIQLDAHKQKQGDIFAFKIQKSFPRVARRTTVTWRYE